MSERATVAAPKKPLSQRAGHSLLLVRLIATSKCLKSLSLIVIGFYLLHMVKLDLTLHDELRDFINAVRLDENNQYIHGLLEKTLGVSREKLRVLSVGTFIYAVLYLMEGIGLFMDKAWAEWMTIITTAGFIPLEIYEFFHMPSITKAVVFLLNAFILVYLILRLHWRYEAKREITLASGGFPVKMRDTQGL